MSRPFEPMLAGKLTKEAQLTPNLFPGWASPKIDGVRTTVMPDAQLRSRKLKAFKNKYIQQLYSDPALCYIDGEFTLGPPTGPALLRRTNSALGTIQGEPDLTLWVFDHWGEVDADFRTRYTNLKAVLDQTLNPTLDIRLVPQKWVRNVAEFLKWEQKWIDMGYEGAMLRGPNDRYKFGRSTVIEGYLLKLKRFDDHEAEVIGIEEEMHNANVAQVSELGRTKRTSHKANKIGKGTMGSLLCRGLNGPFKGVTFNVGSGFTAEDRKLDWMGKIITYTHFNKDIKERPRNPVYKATKMLEDLDLD